MKADRPLTAVQRRVLEAIQAFMPERGRCPTIRELATIIERQVSTTQQHVVALRNKGYLVKESHIAIVSQVEPSSPISGAQ